MILALVGCTFGPGRPFVDLRDATFEARFDPGARDLGGGDVVSDDGLVWRLDRFEARVESVTLQALEGSADFDPADPPPGYSFCHGGHCHADDGSLVDYSVIREQLAGGNATFTPVAAWAPDAERSLLDPDPVDLGRPDDPLPEGPIGRATAHLHDVVLAGEVARDDVPVPFTATVEELELLVGLDFEVGVDAPAAVRLAADWTVDGTLLDGLTGDPSPDAIQDAVANHLADQPLTVELE